MSSRAALAGHADGSSEDGLPDRQVHGTRTCWRSGFPGVPDEVRRTIALLLNELFVTLFPQGHPLSSWRSRRTRERCPR